MFYILCSLNELIERFLGKQRRSALLYWIYTLHTARVVYITRGSTLQGVLFIRALTGKILMFLDLWLIMGGGHLQCTLYSVGFTWNLLLTVILWEREVIGWVFWFCHAQNVGSMFTTFRGGSRGGNFHPWVSKSLLHHILKCFVPPTPYLITAINEVSTGPNVDPLYCRFCAQGRSIEKGGQVIHGLNPITEKYFQK